MKNTVWVITNNSLFYFLPFFLFHRTNYRPNPSIANVFPYKKEKKINKQLHKKYNSFEIKFKYKLKYHKFIDKINFMQL